jgi:hypothetical protein
VDISPAGIDSDLAKLVTKRGQYHLCLACSMSEFENLQKGS